MSHLWNMVFVSKITARTLNIPKPRQKLAFKANMYSLYVIEIRVLFSYCLSNHFGGLKYRTKQTFALFISLSIFCLLFHNDVSNLKLDHVMYKPVAP